MALSSGATSSKMAKAEALKNISNIFNLNVEDQKTDNFYVLDELQFTDLTIEVEGLGKLNLPITEQEVKSLIEISSQTKELEDKTDLDEIDESIQDALEIASDKLNIKINPDSLNRVLSNINKKFYLSDNSYFVAELHNMLIYKPGKYFKIPQDTNEYKSIFYMPRQRKCYESPEDTERYENMFAMSYGKFFESSQDTKNCENNIFATLALILPYPHIGGHLIIKRGNKKFVFSSQNIAPNDIKCIIFFSDCSHQIEEIVQGYRIVTTFNLVLQTNIKENVCIKIKTDNLELQNKISEYFQISSNEEIPKLVVYLNHVYTERTLKWQMLKDGDCLTALSLINIAKNLGLVPYLTMVDVHKSYAGDGEYFIIQLCGWKMQIRIWIHKDYKVSYHDYEVFDNEICSIGSYELEPYKIETEDYTWKGHSNIDHWYKQAAIVLVEESNIIAFNFIVNYDASLQELISLTKSSGNEEKIKNIMVSSGKRLFNSKSQKKFNEFAEIVIYLNDENYASEILKQTSKGYNILYDNVYESLAKLQFKFGSEWVLMFLNKLKVNNEPYQSEYKLFLTNIDTFINEFIKSGGDLKIAEFILEEHTLNLINNTTGISSSSYGWYNSSKHYSSIEDLEKNILAIIKLRKADLLMKIIGHVMSAIDNYSIMDISEFLCRFIKTVPTEFQVYFGELQNLLKEKIDSEIALSMRDEDNWSITTKLRCNCEHCKKSANFLQSKTDTKLVWPIAQKTRNHVMRVIEDSKLPIKLTVETKGSPHRLVIEKTTELHKKSNAKFDKLKIIRQKLLEIEI